MKKIFTLLIAILLGAAGWYFFYWQNTPQYAAGEIQQAVSKKDYDSFRSRVDQEKVYSFAVDDVSDYLTEDKLPEHYIAAALIKGFKKEIVSELIRRTEKEFKNQESGKSIADKPVKTITAYIGSSALSMTDVLNVEEKGKEAVVDVKLHDKDLQKDFTWKVLMEKDVNNRWTAVRVLNLKEYIAEREQLKKQQEKK